MIFISEHRQKKFGQPIYSKDNPIVKMQLVQGIADLVRKHALAAEEIEERETDEYQIYISKLMVYTPSQFHHIFKMIELLKLRNPNLMEPVNQILVELKK